MPTADDVQNAIADNATGPKRVTSDNTSVEQHNLADQIAAQRHLASQDAAPRNHRGLRFTRLIPAGPN